MPNKRIKYHPIKKIIGSDNEIYQLRIVETNASINVEINLELGKNIAQLETISFKSIKSINEIIDDLKIYIKSMSRLKAVIASKGGIFSF